VAERGLGKGFGAIFGENAALAAKGGQGGGLLMLPLERVEPRADQPRTNFDDLAMQELSDSLRTHGMLQPIAVRKLDTGFYQIIAGERRWRAARLAGLSEVPVRVMDADDRLTAELALIENLQREDLNPMEEARGYRSLMEEFGLTQEETARRVGKSRPAVTNSLRLLGLCPSVREMVEDGELSAGHARAILPLRTELQELAARKIRLERLSVRQTEALSAKMARDDAEEPLDDPTNPPEISVDYTKEVGDELTKLWGREVKLVNTKKRGRIELSFYGDDDREALIDRLREIKN